MSSSSPGIGLGAAERSHLLQVAAAAVDHGLNHKQRMPVVARRYPQALRAPRACFVSLYTDAGLRGCVGNLESERPLVVHAARNAHAAAFADPRFPPVEPGERPALRFSVAILGAAVPLRAMSERELLRRIRPGEDGLILQEGLHRATFLPAVWASLTDPADFVGNLKRKAGLPEDHWSETLRFWRYRVESVDSREMMHE